MSNEQIEQFLEKAQLTIDNALNELMEVKMFRENDPTDYSVCQRDLQLLNKEVEDLIERYPDQREKLTETRRRINEIEGVMVKGV